MKPRFMHIVRVFRCSSQSFETHLREPGDTLVCRDTAVENHWAIHLKRIASVVSAETRIPDEDTIAKGVCSML